MSENLVQLGLPSDLKTDEVLSFAPLPEGSTFKVLFVYPNVQRVRTPQLGVAILSSCLKRINARTALFDTTSIKKGHELDAFERAVAKHRPDLLAYSARSNEWMLTKRLIDRGRLLGIPQVVGGPHPTHDPENAMQQVDLIVLGEGEGAMLDVVRSLAMGRDVAGIPNTWVRSGSQIIMTPKRNLIRDLDVLPFPDWQLFGEQHYQRSYIASIMDGMRLVAAIEGSRGCPFTCTYCSNSTLMESYAGQGKWRREKSPERIVEELAAFRELFRDRFGEMDFVYWVDEIWLTGIERLKRFRDLYKRQIGVPFSIMERPECITEEKIRVIADAGLHYIAIGLESGDEDLRATLLNRRTAMSTLVQAFLLPKQHGIKVHAFTMLGLPGQDVPSMMLTWRFMRRIMPTSAQFSIFFPLVGTKLFDYTIQMGMYEPAEDMEESYYSGTVLKQEAIDNKLVLRYQTLLGKYVTKPGLLAASAFHVYRAIVPAYQLRFHSLPSMARAAAHQWRRLRNLLRFGPRKAVGKIRDNLPRFLPRSDAGVRGAPA